MADNPFKLSSLGQQPAVEADQSKIGDLRRRYNFGASVSELAIDQTPFFRFISQVGNAPTDDPEFKSTEERHSFHKRYAYVVAHHDAYVSSGDVSITDSDYAGTALAEGSFAKGQEFGLKLEADFKSAGNVQSILGQTAIGIGASGTKPIWILKDQLLRIPVDIVEAADDGTKVSEDYIIVKVLDLKDGSSDNTSDEDAVYVGCEVIRGTVGAGGNIPVFKGSSYGESAYSISAASGEANKVYAVGSAHAEGSSFPATYKDSPYLVRTGYTQIFKTTCQMTNTARATQLKMVPDEWARIWKNKLIEHKYDMEQALLFGRGSYDASNRIGYTQGIVDFVLQEGNVFSWSESKSQDDFLEDMSDFLDPRYNNANATLFMCSTAVYNWLHKLGGYMTANAKEAGDGSLANSFARLDMNIMNKSKKFGLDITTISTPYGDMNVTRNIHLDGGAAGASIVAVNMQHVKYRPLAGNGINRDTSIYVGVQSLENTGVDRRIDLIQTEAGLQCNMPEAHAVWK